jgi:acyl-CoA synthetase (AMP-forming)/AMP-acid ligase II
MTEPTTVNVGYIVPNTGDLPGTWGTAALNPDLVALDGFQGGVQVISVTGSPITLTAPAGFTAAPGAGPNQSQNAVLRFTGTQTANVTVGLPLPGQQVMLRHEDGTIDREGTGEVVISGPTVMRGYLGRPEDTAATVVEVDIDIRHAHALWVQETLKDQTVMNWV